LATKTPTDVRDAREPPLGEKFHRCARVDPPAADAVHREGPSLGQGVHLGHGRLRYLEGGGAVWLLRTREAGEISEPREHDKHIAINIDIHMSMVVASIVPRLPYPTLPYPRCCYRRRRCVHITPASVHPFTRTKRTYNAHQECNRPCSLHNGCHNTCTPFKKTGGSVAVGI